MGLELVRKPASINNGGELGHNPLTDKVFVDNNVGTDATTLNILGNGLVGRSGALHLADATKTTEFYIYGATSSSATNPYFIGTATTHGFQFQTNSITGGSIDSSQQWSIGPAAITAGTTHLANGALRITGQATSGFNMNINNTITSDTVFAPFIMNSSYPSGAVTARAHYAGNGTGQYWAIGQDNSNQIVMGQCNPSTGFMSTIGFTLNQATGIASLGLSTGSGLLSHTINGKLKVNNNTGRFASGSPTGVGATTSVLGTTGTNFTNGIGNYDYDTGTDQTGGLVVIAWSVNGTRGVTILYKVDGVMTQIAQSSVPGNLTFSVVSTSTGSGTGTQNAIRITSAGTVGPNTGNGGLSVGASVTFIGGI